MPSVLSRERVKHLCLINTYWVPPRLYRSAKVSVATALGFADSCLIMPAFKNRLFIRRAAAAYRYVSHVRLIVKLTR